MGSLAGARMHVFTVCYIAKIFRKQGFETLSKPPLPSLLRGAHKGWVCVGGEVGKNGVA